MLFISGQSFISGGEYVLKNILLNLRSKSPLFLICKDSAEFRAFFSIPGVQVIFFPYFESISELKKRWGPLSYLIKFAYVIRFTFFYLKILSHLKPQIVITNNFSEIPISIVSYLKKISHIQYVHEIIDKNGKTAFIIRFFNRFISKYLCVSKAARKELLHIVPKSNAHVVHNSIDLTKAHPKNRNATLQFLFVGMINSNKDPLRFIKWIKDIEDTCGDTHVKIMYHYYESDLLDECKILAKNYKLSVTWFEKPLQEDIQETILASDFLCVTSVKESFSLVSLQAISSGTPVITTENFGVPEFIEHGYNGFVIKEDSQLKKIMSILDRNTYYELSKNCIESSKAFSHEKMITDFLKAVHD